MSCTGKCCVAFPLNKTLGELAAMRYPASAFEALTILGMIQPLTVEETRERAARFGLGEPDDEIKYYSCRHWDEETRLCTIYDERPWMCRTYPNEDKCDHGCDCKGTPMDQDQSEA
jgi:Fe-S-cluster containining protein